MAGPVPQRIAPLTWRKPALLWTPIALALAIGWPAAVFYNDPAPQRLALVAGAAVFALALISLMGRAPQARRIVVLHVVIAGAFVALAAPFVLIELLALVADYEREGAGESFTFAMSLAMVPLALVIGLPTALLSGIVFAWVALKSGSVGRGDLLEDGVFRDNVQPFR